MENGVYIVDDGNGRIGVAHLFTDGRGGVADGFQNAQLVEIADEVFAPVAGADQSDCHLTIHGSKGSFPAKC